MITSQKIAFRIKPVQKKVDIADYFSWVIKALKVDQTDFEIEHFKSDWPPQLVGFDQVWMMHGDGNFNYFLKTKQTARIKKMNPTK